MVSLWLDAGDSNKFAEKLGISGVGLPAVSLVIGIGVATLTRGKDFTAGGLGWFTSKGWRTFLPSIIIGFVVTMLFFDLTTQQGARAIFFVSLSSLAAVGLMDGGSDEHGKHSQPLGSALLIATAASVAVMAFFCAIRVGKPEVSYPGIHAHAGGCSPHGDLGGCLTSLRGPVRLLTMGQTVSA